jgi:hypothetical protein
MLEKVLRVFAVIKNLGNSLRNNGQRMVKAGNQHSLGSLTPHPRIATNSHPYIYFL